MEFDKKMLDKVEKDLNTAVICDVLDSLGYRNQAMLGSLYPLKEKYKVVGFAKTLLVYDVYDDPKEAYKVEIDAIDSIKEGDLVICSNPSGSNGFWGELLATTAVARGGRGVLVDGSIRDIDQLKDFDDSFKVFTKGRNPLDSYGRCLVAAYDCTIKCDGVIVSPNDMVFGDIDGIVVIPTDLIEKVIELAFVKISKENLVRDELRLGKSLKEVFGKYQVL